MELSERFGRKVANTEEARSIMKIGVTYNSIEETLQNVGLPPNLCGRRAWVLHGLGNHWEERASHT